MLARAFDNQREEPGAVYARHPEQAGRGGLNMLVRDSLAQYRTMAQRKIDRVRLMTERDAKEGGRPDARSANFATLLSCALLCDSWTVEFLPPRPALPEEEDLLKRVAHFAYFVGSEQAYAALELLCDDDVHFGACRGFTKADRLFQGVKKDCDPSGKAISVRPHGLQLRAMSLDEKFGWLLGCGTLVSLK